MGLNILSQNPPPYTTVSIDYLFACTPDYRLLWTRWGGSRTKIFSVRRWYSRGDTVPPGSFPLYTTVSIDYIFACTPDYRLFWTRWGGSRTKIFSVRRGYSRYTVPSRPYTPPPPPPPPLYTTHERYYVLTFVRPSFRLSDIPLT